ncbi:hypothetical protein Baya_1222 [Bagarius yarrelli]|uniref:Uncharacterized protein n=1 Tax=Bagarius yarrelli TaxID=175774 RepID=A0A556TKH1_BAGYA|nr:hypothetical protein Baya_1222 [Bagarius yarrelli]
MLSKEAQLAPLQLPSGVSRRGSAVGWSYARRALQKVGVSAAQYDQTFTLLKKHRVGRTTAEHLLTPDSESDHFSLFVIVQGDGKFSTGNPSWVQNSFICEHPPPAKFPTLLSAEQWDDCHVRLNEVSGSEERRCLTECLLKPLSLFLCLSETLSQDRAGEGRGGDWKRVDRENCTSKALRQLFPRLQKSNLLSDS